MTIEQEGYNAYFKGESKSSSHYPGELKEQWLEGYNRAGDSDGWGDYDTAIENSALDIMHND